MTILGQRPDPGRFQVIPRTLVFALREQQVLLQQVPAERGEWAGLWNGVGGHVEPGESPSEAARREFFEETGLTLERPRLAGTLVVDLGRSPGLVLFVFVGEAGPGEPRAHAEGDLRWFSPAEIGPLPTVTDVPELLARALAVHDGGPIFSGLSFYDPEGRLRLRFDPGLEGPSG